MPRHFDGDKLVIASHNQGKVREITDLMQPFGVAVTSVAALGLPVPVEDGSSFIENANIKSLAAATATGLPALSDDSGLVVDALGGDPGIYSADWAGPERDFIQAMHKVEEKLAAALQDPKTKADAGRRAHFVCALSLAWPDGHVEAFEGKVFGDLVWPMRGGSGFGYDPVFQPTGYTLTFGEMEPREKHAMSHRAKAFEQLIEACFAR